MNPLFYSYEDASKLIDEFISLLLKKGITIKKDSQLERICNNVKNLANPKFDFEPFEDIRPFYREVLGFNDLIIKILKVKDHKKFEIIVKHLNLLNDNTSIPQTVKNVVTDQSSNKIFELVIATSCMKLSEDIEVDDPESSKGNNPDILIKFNDIIFGIACKVMNTTELKIESIIKNLIKGVDQIQNSKASKGIVIINLKNNLYYDDLWPILNEEKFRLKSEEPIYRTFIKPEIPFDMLANYGVTISDNIRKNYGQNVLIDIFKNKKSFPGIYLFLQSATAISKNGKPYPMTCGIFHLLNLLNSKIDDYLNEYQFLDKLNSSMHNI